MHICRCNHQCCCSANWLHAQVNMTDTNIGYLVMDLEKDLSHEVEAALRELPTSIKTRILY